MNRTPCVGIDLGTTCSAIAVVQDGAPKVIQIEGHDLLPSVVVYLDPVSPLVGHPAANSVALHPALAVMSSKRRMGTDHRYL